MNELQEQNTIIIDGMIVDADTGEVIGLAKQEFKVQDEESFNWVMKKILNEESKIAAIDNSVEVKQAQAIIANAESMKKDAQRRLDWLLSRFSAEIGEYARPQLTKGSKSLKTIFGTVAFRTKKAALKVIDEEKAIAWARAMAPTAIKVKESFLISELQGEQREKATQYIHAFKVEPETETVTIKTGVA